LFLRIFVGKETGYKKAPAFAISEILRKESRGNVREKSFLL